jgi:hypothetical protein
MKTTEIVLKENKLVAPILDINFEEVSNALDKLLENYKNIAVTEDTLKAAKEDKRMLASLRTNIESFRKDKKRIFEEPIKRLDANCKELTAKVIEVEKPLQAAIDEYDNKVREEKRLKAEDAILDAISRYSLTDKYSKRLVVKDKYMNLSGSYKSVKEDIEAEAVALKKLQDNEEKLIAEAKGIIDAGNETLTKKFSIDDFSSRVDYFLDQNNAEGFIALIKDKIKTQQKLEETIKAEAIAKEKEKIEKEALEAARKASMTKAILSEECDLPTGISKPVEPPKSVTPIQEQTMYKMNFDVIGSYNDLAKFGKEMSDLCKKYNCTYSVDKTRSGKVKKEGVA